MFFSSLATLGIFWVLFNSITDLAGWTFMEMVFIYAFYMIAISPMQILFDHIWQIRFHVQQGTFLKYYFRPLNMMFYYMSEMFDIKGLTQLAAGIVLLIYSSIQLDLVWSPDKLLLLIDRTFQRGTGPDFDHRDGRLRRLLGGRFVPGVGTGVATAGIRALSDEHLRRRLSFRLHVFDSDWIRGILPVAVLSATGRSLLPGLFFAARRHRTCLR